MPGCRQGFCWCVDQATANLMVGLLAGYGAVTEKVHQRIFQAMKSFDGDGGLLELPGTKVRWPE